MTWTAAARSIDLPQMDVSVDFVPQCANAAGSLAAVVRSGRSRIPRETITAGIVATAQARKAM
jgi:hypothetical protein